MENNIKEKDYSGNPNFLWWFITLALIFGYTGNNWYRDRGDNEDDRENR